MSTNIIEYGLGSLSISEKEDALYHLQFANQDVDDDDYDRDINGFLKGMFDRNSPLAYDAHQITTENGTQLVKVRFKIDYGRVGNYTLETAGKELCKRIFEEKRRLALLKATDQGILGVSAVSITWQDWFATAFFNASLIQGPKLLIELRDAFQTNYVPSWAVVLSIAVFTGLNVGVFLDPVTNVTLFTKAIAALLGPEGGAAAADFLFKLMGKKKARFNMRDLEKNWRQNNSIFHGKVNEAVDSMKAYADTKLGLRTVSGLENAMVAVRIRRSLYSLAEAAGHMVTANEEVLVHLKAQRKELENSMLKAGAAVGVSTFAFASAFWTTTEVVVSVAPLTSWFATGPLVAQTVTTFWWCPPVAITAAAAGVGYSIYMAVKSGERKRVKQQEEHHDLGQFRVYTFCAVIGAHVHNHTEDLILQDLAWGLAEDTDKFLAWVHCVRGRGVGGVEFTNAEVRAKWEQLMRKHTGPSGTVPAEKCTPRFVGIYVKEQAGTLARLSTTLKNNEPNLRFPQ